MTILPYKIKCMTLVFVMLLTQGCGYHLAGTGKNPYKHLHTISIPVLDNTSDEPLIQRDLTESIRAAFLTDGRLQLADEKNGDLILKGAITNYWVRAVAFNNEDIATEYVVVISVNILVKDTVKNKTHLKEKFRTRWDYRSSGEIVSSEAQRQEALNEAYRELATRIVSLVIDKF